MLFDQEYFAARGLDAIYQKVLSQERLTREDGLTLFHCADLTAVGALAAHVRFKKHGATTSYVVNRQINYTNICVNDCLFCAFRRDHPAEPGAFLLSHEEILERIAQAYDSSHSLDELHIVGGCHPDLPLEWFETLLAMVSREFPNLPIKAFTPVEIAHFANKSGLSAYEVLARLKKAGLIMMPGGGAEIFDPALRIKICPSKADAKTWLDISDTAHTLGIKTNCTMLFGHLESHVQRVDHLIMLREQQDRTGGFTCFIPLPFLRKNNKLDLPPTGGEGLDQLRTIAVARLLLDNISHIKAYWIMLGRKMAQTALWYGADDLDGTIVEERIGNMAGASAGQKLTINQLENMIKASGFIPLRRTATFEKAQVAA